MSVKAGNRYNVIQMLPHMRQLVAGTISPEQGYSRFKVMGTCKGIFLGLKFFVQGIFWKKKKFGTYVF